MTLTLSQSFLLQAKEDMKTYKLLCKSPLAKSQSLHFLQMTMEKTGKAYLASRNQNIETLKQSHAAFVKYLNTLRKGCPEDLIKARWRNKKHFSSSINKIKPLAKSIEDLVPGKNNSGLNAEYPWKNTKGEIQVPCLHEFNYISTELNSHNGLRLLKLLNFFLTDASFQKASGIASL